MSDLACTALFAVSMAPVVYAANDPGGWFVVGLLLCLAVLLVVYAPSFLAWTDKVRARRYDRDTERQQMHTDRTDDDSFADRLRREVDR